MGLIIKALARIQNRSGKDTLRLLVVGKGDTEKFKSMAESAGLGGNVVFAGVRHDMEKIYQAADSFVMLSGFDTFGMVVTEAMASGLPVIISDCVGAKDLVVKGENGFVVDRNDEDSIDSAFLQIMEKDRHKLMSGKVMGNVVDYSWDNLAERVMGIYDNF